MNSLSYEKDTWDQLSRRTVGANSSKETTSIVFRYGTKPYTPTSCHYHIRKYGAKEYTFISLHLPYKEIWCNKPYTPIFCNYHTRKLLDTFLSLSNDFKLREMSCVPKRKAVCMNVRGTLCLFDDVQ